MSSVDKYRDRILERPLFYPTFTEPRPVSANPCHFFESKGADMGNEISESGWTLYLDQSLDGWSDKISSEFDIRQQYTEPSERYTTCQYEASSIAGSDEQSSIASVASSRPQKLPLSVQDTEFEQDLQSAGTYSSVSKIKGDAHFNDGEWLECIASCSSEYMNPRKNKLRKLNKDENADLSLQDTASSSVHSPESDLVENEGHIEQNLQLLAESLGDIEEEEVNVRVETLRSLLPHGSKIRREEILGVAIEYIRALKGRIQAVQIIAACSKYYGNHISLPSAYGEIGMSAQFQLPCNYILCKENATATAIDSVHK